MFFKKGILKNFANFTDKHLCWSLFWTRLQARRLLWILITAIEIQCFKEPVANNNWPARNLDLVYHGTIIWTGIACKKIPYYMPGSACRWFIVKKAKMFRSYIKYFWILACVSKCRNWIGQCKQVFLNCPTIFLDWHNKAKLVPASFLAFKTFNKKTRFLMKCYCFNRYNLFIL